MALLAVAAAARWAGQLGPRSLYLDDQALAVLARHAGLLQFFELRPPCPLGFYLLLRGLARVSATSWALQLAAFVPAGLLAIVLCPWVRRVTRSPGAAVFAAALVAANPLVAVYAVRVKPYALEALIATVLARLAFGACRRPALRGCTAVAAISLAALPFSFSALVLAPLFVSAAALALWFGCTERIVRTRVLVICASFAAGLAACAWLAVHASANAALAQYWSQHYVTWGRLPELGTAFITHAFPRHLEWLALALPVGWAFLWRRARAWAWAVLGLYLAFPLLSALELYPLGTGRLDLFSVPLSILLTCAGLAATGRSVLGFLRAPVWLGRAVAGAATLGVLLLAAGADVEPYPSLGDRDAVESLGTQLRPSDHLLVYPLSNHALGLYGRWPVRLVPDRRSTDGFAVRIDLQDVTYLPMLGVVHRFDVAAAAASLNGLHTVRPTRLLFLSSHMDPLSYDFVHQEIARAGYLPRREEVRHGAALETYERHERAWFYDENTGRLFAGPGLATPPIPAPSGPDPRGGPAGVRAHVLRRPDGGESVKFLETTRRVPGEPSRRVVLRRGTQDAEWLEPDDPRSAELSPSPWKSTGRVSRIEWCYPGDADGPPVR